MYNTKEVVKLKNILLVEDDKTIAQGLEYSLEEEGFNFSLAETIAIAKNKISNDVDLVILDLSLPDGSGFDLCQYITSKYNTPIIILTAYDEEVSVVRGLDLGADDYITKPFRVRELISRINSVLRRYNNETVKRVYIDNLEVDITKARIKKCDEEIDLTALEYKLLLIFIKNINQILTRNQILDLLWDGAENFVNDNTLTVYIKRLREKIEDDSSNPKIIKTIRGMGYIMEKTND